jgi:TM2 domain-containing membrane protein YozV
MYFAVSFYFLLTWVGMFVLYVWITDHIWAASRYIKNEEDEHGNSIKK